MPKEKTSYNLLVAKLPVAFAYHRVVDNQRRPADYVFLDVNAAFENITGLKKEQIIDKKASNVLSGSDWFGIYKQIPVSGEKTSFDHYLETLDHWYKITVFSDKPGHLAVIFNDITGYKKDGKLVTANEQLLQSVFDTIQDGISILDRNLLIKKVNKTMEMWYGHALPLQGKPCYEVYQQRTTPCNPCPSINAIRSKQMCTEVVPLTGEKGQVGWLELYSYPLPDDSGEAVGVVEFVRDITKRRQAEDALRESEARYRLLANNARDVIWTMDMNLKFTYMSPSVVYLRGYTAEEVMSQSIDEIFTPDSLKAEDHSN